MNTDDYTEIYDDKICNSNRPIMSVKDEKNQTRKDYFSQMTKSELFLQPDNIANMIKYIIALNAQYKTDNPACNIIQDIPIYMKRWVSSQNLDEYESMLDNWLTTLDFINTRFVKDHEFMYSGNSNALNVYRVKDRVSDPCGITTLKRYDEMTATDYQTIDVWKHQETVVSNALFRYGNRIPQWQKSMQKRPYDRSNDGYHQANSDRASLENQIHGYDMSNIIRGSR
jgi:predicted unusual protein kinase regulating ubiquinone biosynthesis (AarF/ABC1/UbiB family)